MLDIPPKVLECIGSVIAGIGIGILLTLAMFYYNFWTDIMFAAWAGLGFGLYGSFLMGYSIYLLKKEQGINPIHP
jgi:hypothetical protein